MTKEEALKKIEELKMYVADCDKSGYKHGDVVTFTFYGSNARHIVIEREGNLLFLGMDGSQGNICPVGTKPLSSHKKLYNVFERERND